MLLAGILLVVLGLELLPVGVGLQSLERLLDVGRVDHVEVGGGGEHHGQQRQGGDDEEGGHAHGEDEVKGRRRLRSPFGVVNEQKKKQRAEQSHVSLASQIEAKTKMAAARSHISNDRPLEGMHVLSRDRRVRGLKAQAGQSRETAGQKDSANQKRAGVKRTLIEVYAIDSK